MARRQFQLRPTLTSGRGFTLVESVLATAIVGGLVVASLSVIGATAATRAHTNRQTGGELLARDMIVEILAQRYEDPQTPTGPIGVETGESQSPARTTLDDADDYHGLQETPPVARDGSAITMPGSANWTRRTRVRQIDLATLAGVSSDTGALEINVTVLADGRTVANLTAIKTRTSDGAPK